MMTRPQMQFADKLAALADEFQRDDAWLAQMLRNRGAWWRRDDKPWEASDGTRWLWFPRLGEWTGWTPGENGLWNLTDSEFRRSYPEAPAVSANDQG